MKANYAVNKEKVLGDIPPGTFELFSLRRPAEAEATKRIAPAPTVVKHVVKKISEFRVVRKWWENTRFSPENAKNKAENGSFSALFSASVHNGFE